MQNDKRRESGISEDCEVFWKKYKFQVTLECEVLKVGYSVHKLCYLNAKYTPKKVEIYKKWENKILIYYPFW